MFSPSRLPSNVHNLQTKVYIRDHDVDVARFFTEGRREDFYQLSEPRLLICIRVYVLIRKTLTLICKKKNHQGERMSCLRWFQSSHASETKHLSLSPSVPSTLSPLSHGIRRRGWRKTSTLPDSLFVWQLFFFPGKIRENELGAVSSFLVLVNLSDCQFSFSVCRYLFFKV